MTLSQEIVQILFTQWSQEGAADEPFVVKLRSGVRDLSGQFIAFAAAIAFELNHQQGSWFQIAGHVKSHACA